MLNSEHCHSLNGSISLPNTSTSRSLGRSSRRPSRRSSRRSYSSMSRSAPLAGGSKMAGISGAAPPPAGPAGFAPENIAIMFGMPCMMLLNIDWKKLMPLEMPLAIGLCDKSGDGTWPSCGIALHQQIASPKALTTNIANCFILMREQFELYSGPVLLNSAFAD